MKAFRIVLSAALTVSSVYAHGKCVPANELVPFEEGPATARESGGRISVGTYSRISPDGRFIIRSLSGPKLSAATVMEIIKNPDGTKVARPYNTDLGLEAFPVQGTWRFVEDIGANHYKVADIVNYEKEAPRQFRGGERGFYAASAELPGGTDQSFQTRSLAWPQSSNNAGTGYLGISVTSVKKKGNKYEVVEDKKYRDICKNLKESEGSVFTLPMISLDGSEFAATPTQPKNQQPTMRIYRILENGSDCVMDEDLGVSAAKVIFGSSRPGKKAPLVFLGSGNMLLETRCHMITTQQVPDKEDPKKFVTVPLNPPRKECQDVTTPVAGIHYYDRELKKTFYIGDRSLSINADAFPGMTKDGRIVYGASWTECRNEIRPTVIKYEVPVLDKDGKPVTGWSGKPKTEERTRTENRQVQICDDKAGYVISDPNQSEDVRRFKQREPAKAGNFKQCITEAEVAAVEREQAAIYGLPVPGQSSGGKQGDKKGVQ